MSDILAVKRPVINHAGISGGKDSTALMLWCLHESGYPKESLNFSFADTDNEHDLTYDQIVMLSEHRTRALASATQSSAHHAQRYELAKHKKRFPGVKSRFCTQELKIFPSEKHVKALIEAGNDIVMHSGVRAAESAERAKLVQREEAKKHIKEFRPLLRWSIEDVWAIHKRYGIPPHPLYAMGARRVGCLPCIMSRKAEIANIAKRFPEMIAKIREHEGDWGGVRFHGFFTHDKIPRRFHSRKITAADGRRMTVATIDDVVEWATEPARMEAQQHNFFEELDTRAEDRTSCQSSWGSCE